ncbi:MULTISPECIES: lysine N(6)-hydroxylase/L-ornithine N(5)-oxygenase family protein [unclassified Dietzia]|uniref:lysine N(6)-hydroxylase/L-ornithine N(5)-oxygenase family protein n=1 Tax=unclassified Dietzia TaxID=2617939 RepID=UPI000D21B600|nr:MULTISPECIES: SidA/IucD/PvdA family monooxygenase [unclassified Dietzia]AVZ39202.1 L-lysine 6-monooxygenase [Dietzia sp. JS16-p6b]QGW24427.1 L-lysine 6-monooxygenase [Dietzia sp. DQ12-45-1b]
MSGTIHDVLGVGIGPFNLGLACLAEPAGVDAVFLDARQGFTWHHGLMFDDATIQVPFLADLVTLADPTSPYSFLSYLKQAGRLYPFYIRENFQPLRAEYDAYCRWASDRVSGLRWGREVVDVRRETGDEPVYRVTAITSDGTETYRARHLVLGIGTTPWSPVDTTSLDGGSPDTGRRVALHAADYLHRREELFELDSVTVVGSGQSAAEIYQDLLATSGDSGPRVDWITRSPRFFPMEYTKLTLEMTSPEYIDHFHGLDAGTRDRMLRDQRSLYKGIDAELINQIHDLLYRRSAHGLDTGLLVAATALEGATPVGSHIRLDLRCTDTARTWTHQTQGLVMATGYSPTTPRFLDGIASEIDWEDPGPEQSREGRPRRYRVARDHTIDLAHRRIHVQNAEEHTHGLSAPDLGMGAMRNSIILRSVTGREVYPVESRIAFQRFGPPADEIPGARDADRARTDAPAGRRTPADQQAQETR